MHGNGLRSMIRSIVLFIAVILLHHFATPSTALRTVSFRHAAARRWQVQSPPRMSSPASSAGGSLFPFKSMTVAELGVIMKDPRKRGEYQIVDVREPNELEAMSIPGADIINLPISAAETWTKQVLDGQLLDRSKPLLCFCHAGGRSMKAARFFGKNDSKTVRS